VEHNETESRTDDNPKIQHNQLHREPETGTRGTIHHYGSACGKKCDGENGGEGKMYNIVEWVIDFEFV
jgi:hypothetical protein